MRTRLFVLLFLCGYVGSAQNTNQASEEKWGVVLEQPEMKDVAVKSDITYHKDEKGELKMDIYIPRGLMANNKLPAIIFLPENRTDKSRPIYKTWPKLAAANRMIGISLNVDFDKYKESVQKVFDFLYANGTKYKIDTSLLGVFSASHVPDDVINLFVKENVMPGVKAVALYYRNPTLRGPFRNDLPVLWVTDDQTYFAPDRTTPIWNEAQKSKAPWTMVFGKGMPYFFDAFADNDDARRLIRQTIYFWKNYLEPIPSPSWKFAEDREMIAALYGGDRERAARLFKLWLEKNPDDQYALTKYGMLSLMTKEYTEAEAAYKKMNKLTAFDMVNLAKALFALDKKKDAEELISKAVDSRQMTRAPYSDIGGFLYSLGNYKDGITYYERAIQLQSRGADYYNLACGYTLTNEKDKAFDMLNKAAESGFNSKIDFENDNDLTSLRSDARWKVLVEKLK